MLHVTWAVRTKHGGWPHECWSCPNVFLHEFDDWYHRTYRHRPEWQHLAKSSLQYRRKTEIGGTLMLTRYADDVRHFTHK